MEAFHGNRKNRIHNAESTALLAVVIDRWLQ